MRRGVKQGGRGPIWIRTVRRTSIASIAYGIGRPSLILEDGRLTQHSHSHVRGASLQELTIFHLNFTPLPNSLCGSSKSRGCGTNRRVYLGSYSRIYSVPSFEAVAASAADFPSSLSKFLVYFGVFDLQPTLCE